MYCKNCDNYVENKDTMLCASCNRLSRKKEVVKKSGIAIPKFSKKKQKAIREKHKVYDIMDSTTPRICSGCGGVGLPLSHSHIIPVGQYPEFESELINLVYDCLSVGRKGCHDIWEHGTIEEKKKLNNYQFRVSVIKKLKPEYLNRLKLKNEME